MIPLLKGAPGTLLRMEKEIQGESDERNRGKAGIDSFSHKVFKLQVKKLPLSAGMN
jgi:hypothetical protein